jgi:hypothetical protein
MCCYWCLISVTIISPIRIFIHEQVVHELLEFGLAIDILDVAIIKLGDYLRS